MKLERQFAYVEQYARRQRDTREKLRGNSRSQDWKKQLKEERVKSCRPPVIGATIVRPKKEVLVKYKRGKPKWKELNKFISE